MPRVRGGSSQSEFKRGANPTAAYSRNSSILPQEWTNWGSYEPSTALHKFARKNDRNVKRPRTSGLVGPDIDWSIRSSHLRGEFLKTLCLALPKSIRDIEVPTENPYGSPPWDCIFGESTWVRVTREHASYRPPAGCVTTWHLSDRAVYKWTAIAHRLGVHFDGQKGYRLGSSKGDPKTIFKMDKALGLVPKHKRSRDAALRRSLKKTLKAVVNPAPIPSLFVRRCEVSAKRLREEWQNHSGQLTFSEFKSSKRTILTLFPERARMPVSGIVMSSLKKLYSKPVRFDLDKSWLVPCDVVKNFAETLTFRAPISQKTWLKKRSAFHLDELDRGNLPLSTIPVVNRSDAGDLFTSPQQTSRNQLSAVTSKYDVVWDQSQRKYVKRTTSHGETSDSEAELEWSW